MKRLILSDLHLGSPLFTKRKEVIQALCSEEFSDIIFNGDLLDIWETNIDNIKRDNLSIITVINDVSNKKPVYYILGNHDPQVKDIKKIFPNIIIVNELQIDDLFIIHGDEFDNLVTKYSFLAKILFIPHWVGERLGLNIKAFFREITQSVSNKKDKSYYKQLVRDIDKAALKKYSKRCQYLIMGHTHSPKIIESPDCTYINGGDLIHNHTYVVFDIDSKSFEIKKV